MLSSYVEWFEVFWEVISVDVVQTAQISNEKIYSLGRAFQHFLFDDLDNFPI